MIVSMPPNKDTKPELLAKIIRLQQQGKSADEQIRQLTAMMANEQRQLLRSASDKRFGRKIARQLRKKGGEYAFGPR